MSHQGQEIIIICLSVPLSCSYAVTAPLNIMYLYNKIKMPNLWVFPQICIDHHDGRCITGVLFICSMHYVRFILRGGCGVLTYCGYEGGVEGVLAESEQQTCLTDSAVSDEQQLEQIIVRFRHLSTNCGLQGLRQ